MTVAEFNGLGLEAGDSVRITKKDNTITTGFLSQGHAYIGRPDINPPQILLIPQGGVHHRGVILEDVVMVIPTGYNALK